MSVFFNTNDSFRSDLFDAVCRMFGYICNLHEETYPYAEPRPSGRSGFFSFERRIVNAETTEYWGLGRYLLVCKLLSEQQKREQRLQASSVDA